MLRRLKNKRVAVVVSALAALALAVGAYAYFTSTGTSTSQASVGSSAPFTVTFGTESGTMYPGAGSSSIPYTITNPGSGSQNLAATTVSVAQDSSGNITDHGASVSGCLASWFNPTDNHPNYGEMAPNGTKTGTVTVTMTDDPSSQDSCQGHTPDVVVNAS